MAKFLFRQNLFTAWKHHLDMANITYRSELARTEFLSDPDQRLQWQSHSLPTDDLCTENAIMLSRYKKLTCHHWLSFSSPSEPAVFIALLSFHRRSLKRPCYFHQVQPVPADHRSIWPGHRVHHERIPRPQDHQDQLPGRLLQKEPRVRYELLPINSSTSMMELALCFVGPNPALWGHCLGLDIRERVYNSFFAYLSLFRPGSCGSTLHIHRLLTFYWKKQLPEGQFKATRDLESMKM